MKNVILVIQLLVLIGTLSCTTDESQSTAITEDAEVRKITVFAQNRPFGEPLEFDMQIDSALDKLEFVNPDDVFLDSTDLVIGLLLEESQVAIPLTYMSAFEVANFSTNSNSFLVTWCPIVGSARIFEGGVANKKQGFDFGRGLYNNNLLVVDRNTETVWNQLSGQAIHGELQGDYLTPLPSIQCTWSFWRNKYPSTKVAINKDTTGAIFPESVGEKPYYNNWQPGDGRPKPNDFHQTGTLGIGISIDSSSVFLPFENLFSKQSPIDYKLNDELISIHFNKDGITAWAEDGNGNMIPSAIVYNWAWKSFYPNTVFFEE